MWVFEVLLMMRLCLLIVISLLLAGCYRPAGDAPAPVVAEPIDSSGSADVTALPTVPAPLLTTPSLPPVTIISPTRPTQVFGQPLATPTAMTGGAQGLPTPTSIDGAGNAATTPVFITPGVPMGAVTLVLPTATSALSATTTPSGLVTPTTLGIASGECTYVVQAGDNLFRIAVNNDATLEEMRAANPQLVGEAPILQPGQELFLPGCEAGAAAPTLPAAAVVTSAAPAAPTGTNTYVVQAGDTLFTIAQQFGVTIDAIVTANNLANPNALSVGQQLIIPAAP
jgi:LysM repeat protein